MDYASLFQQQMEEAKPRQFSSVQFSGSDYVFTQVVVLDEDGVGTQSITQVNKANTWDAANPFVDKQYLTWAKLFRTNSSRQMEGWETSVVPLTIAKVVYQTIKGYYEEELTDVEPTVVDHTGKVLSWGTFYHAKYVENYSVPIIDRKKIEKTYELPETLALQETPFDEIVKSFNQWQVELVDEAKSKLVTKEDIPTGTEF